MLSIYLQLFEDTCLPNFSALIFLYFGNDILRTRFASFFHLHTSSLKLTVARGCGTKAYDFTALASCSSLK